MVGRKAIIAVAIVLALAIAIPIIYGNLFSNKSLEESPGEDYITITDFANRTVKVPRGIKRIVAIDPGTLRLVAYLNAVDMVVGVEEIERRSTLGRDYAMAYGDVFKNLPVIGPGGPRSAPDPERIRSVKPDLVIMSRIYVSLYDPDRLSEEVGAPVIVVDYGVAGYLDCLLYTSDAADE